MHPVVTKYIKHIMSLGAYLMTFETENSSCKRRKRTYRRAITMLQEKGSQSILVQWYANYSTHPAYNVDRIYLEIKIFKKNDG
jgi:hypothetical protein